MTRFRQLVKRYPIAAVAVVALLPILGWRLHQAMIGPETRAPLPPPAARTHVPPPSGASSPESAAFRPAGAQGAHPAGSRQDILDVRDAAALAGAQGARPAGAASQPSGSQSAPTIVAPGQSSGTGQQPGGMPGAATPGAENTAPASSAPGQSGTRVAGSESGRDPFISPIGTGGGVQALPPVPPLLPGGLPVPGAPGGPSPTVLAGVAFRVAGVLGGSEALAILEDGTKSYIVAPGDVLAPGVRVVAIDVGRGVVALIRNGVSQELYLERGGKAP